MRFGKAAVPATAVTMPEATIDENDFLSAKKSKIGATRQVLRVQTIPVTHGEDQAPYDELRLGVL
jgi:hypothetical protein